MRESARGRGVSRPSWPSCLGRQARRHGARNRRLRRSLGSAPKRRGRVSEGIGAGVGALRPCCYAAAETSPPAAARAVMTPTLPHSAAPCSAVQPLRLAAVASAPDASSERTRSSAPGVESLRILNSGCVTGLSLGCACYVSARLPLPQRSAVSRPCHRAHQPERSAEAQPRMCDSCRAAGGDGDAGEPHV